MNDVVTEGSDVAETSEIRTVRCREVRVVRMQAERRDRRRVDAIVVGGRSRRCHPNRNGECRQFSRDRGIVGTDTDQVGLSAGHRDACRERFQYCS